MTTLQLPTLDAIDAAAMSLSVTANKAEQRALIRAQFYLHKGASLIATNNGILISGSRGDVYRVASDGTCSCPASGLCWHQQAIAIIEEAHAHPTMPRLIRKSKEQALAEINELFN